MRWFVDVVTDGLRRRRGALSAVRFLRHQLAIRLRSLREEARGTLADLWAYRHGAGGEELLILIHRARLRPGALIEAGLEDLRDRLLARDDVAVVSSRLGYRLRARLPRQVISLEPIAAAPAVRFSRRHTSVVVVADVWDKVWMARQLRRCRATAFVTPYRWCVADVPALRGIDPDRWHLLPWWVPDDVVAQRPARTRLNADLAVVGALGPMYDLRAWISGNPMVTDRFHVSAHESTADRLDHTRYFDLLASRSAVVVAFSEEDAMRVPVAKYVEVPAVGALLVGARAHHLEEMGFRDGENCIIFEGREDFARKAAAFLARPEDYVDIAARGLQLVRTHHTTSARIRQVEALLSP